MRRGLIPFSELPALGSFFRNISAKGTCLYFRSAFPARKGLGLGPLKLANVGEMFLLYIETLCSCVVTLGGMAFGRWLGIEGA